MERPHYEGRRSSLINKSMLALKDNATRYSSKVEPLTSNYPRKRSSSMVIDRPDSPKEARLDPGYNSNSNNAAAAGSLSSNKGALLREYVRDKIDRNFSRQGTNEPSNVYQLPEYLPLESEGPRDRTLGPQRPVSLKGSRMHPYEPKVPSKDRHHLRGPGLADLSRYVNEREQNAAGAKNFRDRLRRISDGSRPYSESLKSYHIPKVTAEQRISKDSQERSVSQDKTPKLPEAKNIYKSSSNPGSPRYTPTNTPPISPIYNKKDLPTTKNGASPIDTVSSHADTVSSHTDTVSSHINGSKPDIGCDTSGNRNHLDGDGGKQTPTLAKDPRRPDTSTHDVLPFENFNTTTDKNGASLSSDPKGVSQNIKVINPKMSKPAAITNRGPEAASSSKPPQRLDSRDKYPNYRIRKSSNSGMPVKDSTSLCKPPPLPTGDKRHASGNGDTPQDHTLPYSSHDNQKDIGGNTQDVEISQNVVPSKEDKPIVTNTVDDGDRNANGNHDINGSDCRVIDSCLGINGDHMTTDVKYAKHKVGVTDDHNAKHNVTTTDLPNTNTDHPNTTDPPNTDSGHPNTVTDPPNANTDHPSTNGNHNVAGNDSNVDSNNIAAPKEAEVSATPTTSHVESMVQKLIHVAQKDLSTKLLSASPKDKSPLPGITALPTTNGSEDSGLTSLVDEAFHRTINSCVNDIRTSHNMSTAKKTPPIIDTKAPPTVDKAPPTVDKAPPNSLSAIVQKKETADPPKVKTSSKKVPIPPPCLPHPLQWHLYPFLKCPPRTKPQVSKETQYC